MAAETILLERLRDVVPSGGAVCLLGAGFSREATDQNGKRVPGSQELIEEIKAGVGIDSAEEASLTDIADFCENDPERQHKLLRILIDRLTLSVPAESQRLILRQPWRSIFTTNFDDVIEQCLEPESFQCITPVTESTARSQGKIPLYYMHGRAKDLLESNKNPGLVISERNYLQLRDERRELYAQLRNELFAAMVVVIIGYSMRDLEVARIILESGHAFRGKLS